MSKCAEEGHTKGWPPGRRSHCSGCHENFTTPANFARHLRFDHDCKAAGLELNARDQWREPGEPDLRERFAK